MLMFSFSIDMLSFGLPSSWSTALSALVRTLARPTFCIGSSVCKFSVFISGSSISSGVLTYSFIFRRSSFSRCVIYLPLMVDWTASAASMTVSKIKMMSDGKTIRMRDPICDPASVMGIMMLTRL